MTLVLAMLCVFVATLCQTTVGFGFALIFVPLTLLFSDVKETIAVSLLLGPLTSLPTALELWSHARWRVVAGLVAGSFVGVPAGTALFVLASPTTLRVLVACLILFSVVAMLRGLSLPKTKSVLAPALAVGAISGVLRSATSMGGPPVALYLLGLRYPTAAFVGTNSTYFLLGSVASIAGLLAAGRITGSVLELIAVSIPALVIGVWSGRRLRARFSERVFRALAGALLAASSCAILIPLLVTAAGRLAGRF